MLAPAALAIPAILAAPTAPRFEKIVIDPGFRAESAAVADMDGDGRRDLVSGKRYRAHGGRDPGAREPAVLVWLENLRGPGGITWRRHVIDADSGVGYQIALEDIDEDGDLDIFAATRKGAFLFRQAGSPQPGTWRPLLRDGLAGWRGDRKLWSVEGGVGGYQADIGRGWWGTLYDEHGRAGIKVIASGD